jgi:hypothetical protein
MSTEHQLELLNDAYQAWVHADAKVYSGDMSADAVNANIRAMNVMFDRALDCGMPMDTARVADWAAGRITRWLVEA